MAEAVKQKYGGNFSAVSGFSFFGGNVNGDSKLGGSCGAWLHSFRRSNERQTSFPTRLTFYIYPSNVWFGVFMPKLVEVKTTGKNVAFRRKALFVNGVSEFVKVARM